MVACVIENIIVIFGGEMAYWSRWKLLPQVRLPKEGLTYNFGWTFIFPGLGINLTHKLGYLNGEKGSQELYVEEVIKLKMKMPLSSRKRFMHLYSWSRTSSVFDVISPQNKTLSRKIKIM